MKGMWVGYDVGCTMGLTCGHGAWQIDRQSNGSMWNSYSFQPVGQWMSYSFTDLGAEGCCRSLNALFYLVKRSNLGFPSIIWRTHWGNGLKCCMRMYLDHLKSWIVYGDGLLIFLFLVLFWLGKMCQIWGFLAFPGERMEAMAWNFACCCILATFRTD